MNNFTDYKYQKFTKRDKIINLIAAKFYDCEFSEDFSFDSVGLNRNRALEFYNCKFDKVNFGRSQFIGCLFDNCVLTECLMKSTFTNCKLNLNFIECEFEDMDFKECNFSFVGFKNNIIEINNFQGIMPSLTFDGCEVDYFVAHDNKIKGVVGYKNMRKEDFDKISIPLSKVEFSPSVSN